jgi:4-hydroxythreonine-4-phosphate dehydrogenase
MTLEQPTEKPAVGIILGDPAGIGPEIALKLMMRSSTYANAHPILIGNYELLCKEARAIDCELFFKKCTPDTALDEQEDTYLQGIPVVDIAGDTGGVTIGQVSAAAGRIAYDSIVCGYQMLERGTIAGLIMAPINKQALCESGCGFQSEYELFAELAGASEVQSVVKGGSMFRSSVVGHVPFRRIVELLTTERIVNTGRSLYHVLRKALDEEPQICVAALNPHGGEGGILGQEEIEIIEPAVEELRHYGISVHGPFPSDTIYSRATSAGYNGIVYLYHDQGNIAMKAKMFETTALIYTNVPYPILSTGHGSAMDIAPLGIANPTNLCYVMSTLTGMLRRTADIE